MSMLNKLIELRARKAEIEALDKALAPKRLDLKSEFEAKERALQEEFNSRLQEMQAPLVKKAEEYKAECKQAFGITEGERIDVLDTVSMVLRLAGRD